MTELRFAAPPRCLRPMLLIVPEFWARTATTPRQSIARLMLTRPFFLRSSFKTHVGWLGSNGVSPQAAVSWGFAALNPSHTLPKAGSETASRQSKGDGLAVCRSLSVQCEGTKV